tara:strand:- start:3234 stop:3788 length:555 start_codon:yes stop_codon:yes gene_type:complete
LFLKKNFLILVFLSFSFNAYAIDKRQIINQLNSLNSLEFSFSQSINNITENGKCILKFPGKLKCEYFDDKKKELIINNKRLVITQRRYNKSYFYPMSQSPFLNILYKEKLLEIVKNGKLELSDNLIKLIHIEENNITIFFDEDNLNLKGWKVIDQFNNNINFTLKIIAKNKEYRQNTFRIPDIN